MMRFESRPPWSTKIWEFTMKNSLNLSGRNSELNIHFMDLCSFCWSGPISSNFSANAIHCWNMCPLRRRLWLNGSETWREPWKTGSLPLTIYASDVFFGFRTQTMLRMLMYDSIRAGSNLHHIALAHPDKTFPLLRARSKDERHVRYLQSFTHIGSRVPQRLEASPRPPTTHLALHHDVQPLNHGFNSAWRLAEDLGRTEDLEAALGDGHAPVRGTPVMTMTPAGRLRSRKTPCPMQQHEILRKKL